MLYHQSILSQERMTYVAPYGSLDGIAKVIYESKDGKTFKTFDALDWLAQLTTHNRMIMNLFIRRLNIMHCS